MFRPCDAVETAECWQLALEAHDRPSVLALTRQNLPQLRRELDETNRCAGGAYEIVPAEGRAQVSLFASGSEVAIAVEARKLLSERGVLARVVSVPCLDLLHGSARAHAPRRHRQRAGQCCRRSGHPPGLGRHHRSDGAFVGMTGFGASAPYKDLYKHFGITPQAVADAALSKL